MIREKIQNLEIIFKTLENILPILKTKGEWLTITEVAQMLKMSPSTIRVFKDRILFKPFIKNTKDGCKIKNCEDSIKLLQCYKYRNFEYERMVAKNEL